MANHVRLATQTAPAAGPADAWRADMPAPRPQLALVASQETVRRRLLQPNRRLGAWLCIASTVGFWSALLGLVL